jgi:hypothetical protein
VTRVAWDEPGERFYETGVDRCVLYVAGLVGVAWNGLTAVSETPSGGESTAYYIDGFKYLNVSADEEFAATIEAYTYPQNFSLCDGSAEPYTGLFLSQQKRKSFGLTYRTLVGNDLEMNGLGYKIHIVYNALAEPTQKDNKTVGANTDPSIFNWKLSTLAPAISGYRPTAHFMIDTRYASPLTVAAIEDILYGTAENSPRLPTQAEVFAAFEANSTFIVIDNGDGTANVSGTELEVHVSADPTIYVLTSPGVVELDADTYTLTSH